MAPDFPSLAWGRPKIYFKEFQSIEMQIWSDESGEGTRANNA